MTIRLRFLFLPVLSTKGAVDRLKNAVDTMGTVFVMLEPHVGMHGELCDFNVVYMNAEAHRITKIPENY